MKRYNFWIIITALLMALLFVQYKFIKHFDLSDAYGYLWFSFDILINISIPLATGTFLSVIVAIIPFRKKEYAQKFKTIFPIITSLTIVIGIVAFSKVAYFTKEPKIYYYANYDNVKVPPGLDCSTVKDGNFETETVIIEREGDKQIEIQKRSNLKKEFKVEWPSEYEYTLTPINKSTVERKIKIIEVTKDGYVCYVTSGQLSMRHVVSRIKNNP